MHRLASSLPVCVCVSTGWCKDFSPQETQELCQAREAVMITQMAYDYRYKYCCKVGDGYRMTHEKCEDIKREDCDSRCRQVCSYYAENGGAFIRSKTYWELLEPLKELEKHTGATTIAGIGGYPFAISARAGSTIFVSFKGTSETEDWAYNVIYFRAEFTTQEWNLPGQQPHLWVHKGFLTYYSGVKHQIFNHVDRMMKKSPASEIHVSGHSLGGAMANLGAVDLAAKYPNVKVALWTFGAPRVFRSPIDGNLFQDKDSAYNGG